VPLLVRARSDAAGLDHSTVVTVYCGLTASMPANEIYAANFGDALLAFGFALPDPAAWRRRSRHGELNSCRLIGGDYANASSPAMAWSCLVKSLLGRDTASGAGTHGVTLSNPDLQVARLGPAPTTLDTKTPQVTCWRAAVDGRSPASTTRIGKHAAPAAVHRPRRVMTRRRDVGRAGATTSNPLLVAISSSARVRPQPGGVPTRLDRSTRTCWWAVKPA
jgi:hypothetical protein